MTIDNLFSAMVDLSQYTRLRAVSPLIMEYFNMTWKYQVEPVQALNIMRDKYIFRK